jgi:hypothetical protein
MVIPQVDFTFWITQCLAMALAVLLIPKLRVTSIFGPILAVVTLALINTTVWSSQLFSVLPSAISAQTLILLLINGAIFWAVVKILPGIETDGILPSLIAPVVFTLCTLAVPRVVEQVNWDTVLNQTKQIAEQVKSYVQAPVQQEAAPRD